MIKEIGYKQRQHASLKILGQKKQSKVIKNKIKSSRVIQNNDSEPNKLEVVMLDQDLYVIRDVSVVNTNCKNRDTITSIKVKYPINIPNNIISLQSYQHNIYQKYLKYRIAFGDKSNQENLRLFIYEPKNMKFDTDESQNYNSRTQWFFHTTLWRKLRSIMHNDPMTNSEQQTHNKINRGSYSKLESIVDGKLKNLYDIIKQYIYGNLSCANTPITRYKFNDENKRLKENCVLGGGSNILDVCLLLANHEAFLSPDFDYFFRSVSTTYNLNNEQFGMLLALIIIRAYDGEEEVKKFISHILDINQHSKCSKTNQRCISILKSLIQNLASVPSTENKRIMCLPVYVFDNFADQDFGNLCLYDNMLKEIPSKDFNKKFTREDIDKFIDTTCKIVELVPSLDIHIRPHYNYDSTGGTYKTYDLKGKIKDISTTNASTQSSNTDKIKNLETQNQQISKSKLTHIQNTR